MVKYLSKFLKDRSEVCEPMRRLTHKATPWMWGSLQEQSFQKMKALVSEAPVLRYFNSRESTEGEGDASSKGLGFVLMQSGQPISFASRALTAAETRYSQIEKELLAQVFGLEHHHQYVFGRKITLWTDHKPLVSISRKPLASAPKRLQRLLLRLMQYDVEICYRPGKELVIPDTLSRAYLEDNSQSQTEEETEIIHVMQFLPMSRPQFEEIQKETGGDDTLQQLKEMITCGWPEKKEQIPTVLHPYYSVHDELSVQDGVIFKGQRCIIPPTLRHKIREKIHASHIGLQACLRRAREVVYWPGMNKDLTDYISQCETCASYQMAQAKEPLISHELPSRPWEKIASDIFTYEEQDYLCTVDYFSDYFEIDKLHKKTGKSIIGRLKNIFTTHGIPDKLMSDNGPPFDSGEFVDFASFDKLSTLCPEQWQS